MQLGIKLAGSFQVLYLIWENQINCYVFCDVHKYFNVA
jgi:hypothetical protein